MNRLLSCLIVIFLANNSFACNSLTRCLGWSSVDRCPRDCGKKEICCQKQGGISYCDSSAGRYVCNFGGYSSCYCTRHAVIDVQNIQGCCLWEGGVSKISSKGLVICNSGGISEMCSRVLMKKPRGTL